jgi:hypothetical protein
MGNYCKKLCLASCVFTLAFVLTGTTNRSMALMPKWCVGWNCLGNSLDGCTYDNDLVLGVCDQAPPSYTCSYPNSGNCTGEDGNGFPCVRGYFSCK